MNIALCLALTAGMGHELPGGPSFPESHQPLVPTARLDHSVLLLGPSDVTPCRLNLAPRDLTPGPGSVHLAPPILLPLAGPSL